MAKFTSSEDTALAELGRAALESAEQNELTLTSSKRKVIHSGDIENPLYSEDEDDEDSELSTEEKAKLLAAAIAEGNVKVVANE